MDPIDYIDSYFSGTLPPDEASLMDQKIASDPAFAEEVAFYCSAMQTAKNQLLEERKRRFTEIYHQSNSINNNSVRFLPSRKWWSYAAVAATVAGLVIGWFLFLKPASPRQLADRYLQEQFSQLGVNMSVQEESMGIAKNLFNEKKFAEALQQFEMIIRKDSNASDAFKYAGLACVMLKKYDKALDYFQRLENIPHLYINPGKLFHALTLMERDQPGDKELARQLLQMVVEKDLDGKKVAKEWLKKL